MTCQRAIDEFLSDYLEDKLGRLERARFQLHLALCSHCRRYLETYRRTVALGKASLTDADQPVSSEVPEQLVQAILAARGERKS
ncbi:MAG TPA: zf-HC2 domain-containing protein [Terriglobales bacterium]|nr:zf-HC2 domain-containing protein [Terriglobales bacterium]